MLHIPPMVEQIQALLNQDTDQSLRYAALEARLALEMICYDRLRQAHDYISHDQLLKWQPGDVVKTLIAEVDPHVARTQTLYISRHRGESGVEPNGDDWVEIGRQIGFSWKKVTKLWNALGGLALHVRLPRSKDDPILAYGNKEEIREKVISVVAILNNIAKTTMGHSGIGPVASFECICGETNRRRAELLQAGQSVCCINPKCKAGWTVVKNGDEITVEPEMESIHCVGCGKPILLHRRTVMSMPYGQTLTRSCQKCGTQNHVQWRLRQVRPTPAIASPEQTETTVTGSC
jgi:hypothetical protein